MAIRHDFSKLAAKLEYLPSGYRSLNFTGVDFFHFLSCYLKHSIDKILLSQRHIDGEAWLLISNVYNRC